MEVGRGREGNGGRVKFKVEEERKVRGGGRNLGWSSEGERKVMAEG